MFAMLGMVSLAVDWGRAQTAKTELQDAVDAAARYAAQGLADGTYLTKAQSAASQNSVDGSALAIQSGDVQVGNWNTTSRTFTANGTPSNAVRVTGYRNATRGNAVPLVFGRIIGMNSVAVTASSIARQSGVGIVGISGITLNSNGVLRRASTEGGGVTVASNGTISFASGTNTITGDVLYYATAPTGTVTGKKIAMSAAFDYPTAVAPGTYTGKVVGNAVINTTGTFGGVWVVTGTWTCSSGGVLNLSSDLDVYVAGAVSFTGTFRINNNGYRLTTHSTGTSPVTVNCSNNLACGFYAPDSTVTFQGTGTVTGSVVANSLVVQAPLEYSSSVPIPQSPTGGDANLTAYDGVLTVK